MEQRVGHLGECIGWQRNEVIWKRGPLAKVKVERGPVSRDPRWTETWEELWIERLGSPCLRLNWLWVRWIRAGALAGVAVVLALIWR